jgi:predicted dehydrogenase
VRGNWHNENASAFSLLAKCCHDVDLLVYWMGAQKKCKHVSSFGSLFYFNERNAPIKSTNNCFTCPCEPQCAYSAKKLYIESKIDACSWPCSVVLQSEIADNIPPEAKTRDIEDTILVNGSTSETGRLALLEKCLRNEEKTSYGRCVFKIGDNDVCDNQVVNMEFDDSSTATLTMIAFSKDTCVRKTKVYGTQGELEWDNSRYPNQIAHYDFLTKKTTMIDCNVNDDEELKKSERANKNIKLSGHCGTDYWLMHRFVEACLTGNQSLVLTDLEDSLRSHLIVFAAEHSRRTKQVVDIDEFCKRNDIQL